MTLVAQDRAVAQGFLLRSEAGRAGSAGRGGPPGRAGAGGRSRADDSDYVGTDGDAGRYGSPGRSGRQGGAGAVDSRVQPGAEGVVRRAPRELRAVLAF